MYDLRRKGTVFHWGDEQRQAFEEIKRQLQKPLVLYMPDNKGRFQCKLLSLFMSILILAACLPKQSMINYFKDKLLPTPY